MARVDIYTGEDRGRERQERQAEISFLFGVVLVAIPFALLFIGAGLSYAGNLPIGVILIIVGLIWISIRYKIKSVKLVVLGLLTIASLFYLFATIAYPLSRYSLENRITSGVIAIVCGFLFYRTIKKIRNKKKRF